MTERSLIENYLQGESGPAVSSLSAGLLDGALVFQKLIESLAPELTHTEVEVRARGTRLLSDLVHALPGTFFKEPELNHLCTFFCDRLKDQHVVIPHVLFGILALVQFHPLSGEQAEQILQSISKEVHVQAMIRVDRSVIYNIVHALLDNHMEGLQCMGADFVFAFIQMMDGEQDPRNLLLTFNLIPTIVKNFPIDRFVEDLFDVSSCYFPITFTPQADDPSAITQEQLCGALRACLCSSAAFANLTLELLLEKMAASVASAKLESVVTLTTGAPVFGAQKLGQYIEGIWLALCKEMFRASSENLVNACLQCVTVLTQVLCTDTSDEHLKDFIGRILKECCHHFKQPQLGLSSISCQILSAVCAGSAAGCSLILSEAVPVIVEQCSVQTSSNAQCSVMDSLTSLFSAAVDYHTQTPATAVLEPFLDPALAVISTSINDGDASLRLYGCKCLDVLLGSTHVLSADQVALCVEHIVRVLQSDDSDDVRSLARQLAGNACRNFPERGLQSIVPSISEWLQLKRTCCDAGLKPHVTESYILSLTSAVANNTVMLPTLVELWLGHLEFLMRGDWCDGLVERCQVLLTAIDAGLAVCRKESAMLDLVWQPVVLHLVDNLFRAAKSECQSTRSQLFSDLRIVQLSGKLVGGMAQSANTSVQSGLVERLIAASCQSDSSFAPLSASASPRQSQIVVLLASVLPCVQRSALPDAAFNLLSLCVSLALSSPHDESATSACVLSAALLNKLSDDTTLSASLQTVTAAIGEALTGSGARSAVRLLAWVTRAMVLRSHQSCLELSAKLISLFTREADIASSAAAVFAMLLDDSVCRNLTQTGGATVRFLYIQKYFVQIRPQLVDGFKEAQQGVVKEHYLTALSHLLFSVPEQILLSEIPPLLPLVVQCLSSSDAKLLTSSLTAVMALLNGAPDLLSTYASDLIPVLITMSRFKESMKVRQSSLKCLGTLTSLPHHLLYPHKSRVVQALVASLDDRKRLVRQEAVQCRNQWILLGSAAS